jgi:hypothetical protein
MSKHVYIAFDRFKDSPIPLPAWEAAVARCPALQGQGGRRRDGTPFAGARLAADPGQRLQLDAYGLGHAQDPSRELVEAMFQLSTLLGAGVYSERCKRYASPADWERRTVQYRQAEAARRARLRRQARWRLAWIVAVPLLGALLAALSF